MKLTNTELQNFIGRIKLKKDNMPKYRDQITNLKERLDNKIKNDNSNEIKITKYIIAGSWKKGTILRHTGENPIDVDLVLYIESDTNLKDDVAKLHDYVVSYLRDIYPSKSDSDIIADGKTKTIKIRFVGTGLEVDIVPVIPLNSPAGYVWQPERGGGGRYILSVSGQLEFASDRKKNNSSYTSIVRALKWWRNYKELKPDDDTPGLSSFNLELLVSFLDIKYGVEGNIEEGIIRAFKYLSDYTFPTISFAGAINAVPSYDTPIYIADPTNNENNSAKKIDTAIWSEIKKEANDAFESLSYAQSKNFSGDTIEEWKRVFGPSFNINQE